MRYLHNIIRHTTIIASIFLLSLAAGCSNPGDDRVPGEASKLGDLTEFHSIAVDVAGLVEKNDLPTAKARIKDLESAWDSAEAGIKPRAASDWHVLDKDIDHALSALRAKSPDQAKCKTTMDDLLKAFDSMKAKT
ncbi:hypothetical protein LOY64_18950 [Pseudomonas corrugata]|uniref:Uncharacterized protein n=1 Tax=Pseudomonas corrugata TaxID=47879 RepID=A0A8B6UK59_9PSED|nr:hypothetical protein [Pseudomonas corrugata]AOE61131.1 hypothetical protein AXG94_04865 [Pseudomonas corrugata]MDU9023318.1 hypothetical protein [Pseudomonas corrugata]MDU9032938.1 hypothetical protein [Pseudomonas corrugata]MDU9037998.1 hypothetical protein [Pseudomonas corrugata]QTH12286.1 hypothetical protein C4C32_16955 [Pseudomonas corrugata]